MPTSSENSACTSTSNRTIFTAKAFSATNSTYTNLARNGMPSATKLPQPSSEALAIGSHVPKCYASPLTSELLPLPLTDGALTTFSSSIAPTDLHHTGLHYIANSSDPAKLTIQCYLTLSTPAQALLATSNRQSLMPRNETTLTFCLALSSQSASTVNSYLLTNRLSTS